MSGLNFAHVAERQAEHWRSLYAMRALLILLVLCCSAACYGQSPTPDVEDLRASAVEARTHGDVPKATLLFRRAVTLDPGWLEGWWSLGNLQYHADNYDEARTSFSHFLDLSSNSPAALALRGLCEFETADFPESINDIQRALALGAANQPRNGQILLYHEALLLTRLGRFDEAVARYTQFVKRGIVNPEIETGFGLAGLRMPLLPGAIEPADARLISMAGQAAITTLSGGTTTGREAFQAVQKAYPAAQFVHYFCGYLLFTENPDLAIAEFKLELAGRPTSPLAHAMLAWAYGVREDHVEALSNAQAAVAEDPNLIFGQLVLGRALLQMKDINGALPHLQQVEVSEPANMEAHISMAKAYSELGRKDDARRERQLCLNLSEQQSGQKPVQGAMADENR